MPNNTHFLRGLSNDPTVGQQVSAKKSRKKLWIGVAVFVCLLVGAGGAFAWKTGVLLNKISGGHANIFNSLVKSLPGVEKKLSGEDTGKINILLLGMRGAGDSAGGLLADTIMVLSIHPKMNDTDTVRASLVSIPRDLYVTVPGRDEQRKINAVYALGEERKPGGGIEDMRTMVGTITGMDIPYAVALNFQGFKEVVNAVGGITVHLDQPFEENIQFRGLAQRCDLTTYTVPSGQYETKRVQRKNGTYYIHPKQYPLCFQKMTGAQVAELECGGDFKLPAGDNVLDGDKALCYARARYTSSDFERARRQQEVIKLIKAKATSIGTLTDFSKVNALLNALGNNVTTNLEAWEMQRLFDLYKSVGDTDAITQKVLEDSEEGLLYAPAETKATGYILLPRGDNYDRIKSLFQSLP